MQNKIDKIITLSDSTKHMILDQGNYNGKAYFLTTMLDNNNNLSNKLSIVEEINTDGMVMIQTVSDEKLLEALINYFKKRFEVNA